MNDAAQRHNKDKRVIRTKAAIKKALFGLMEKKDLAGITIIELSREAGVNRRTFYTHYRNISDILDEIEKDIMEEFKAIVDGLDFSDLRKSVHSMFKGMDKMINEDFGFYFKVIHIDTHGTLIKRLKGIISGITDINREKMNEKYGENADAVASFIVGGFFNCYFTWYNTPGKTASALEAIADQVGNMVEVITASSSRLPE